MATPTGISVLDGMLNGGLPDCRATLVVGGPGSGKTTLAMQYLIEGIERGERCLFVSTEQTPAELRDSFIPYDFDLDHELLTVETIHATQGQTVEQGSGGQMVLGSLADHGSGDADDDVVFGGGPRTFGQFSTPFAIEGIRDVLHDFGPCDRVVFDSISGLEMMADDPRVYRRGVLDIIRLFTDEFEATALFTAEEPARERYDFSGSASMLRFNTHGVIRLWREQVDGDFHRFIQVEKMRGVDHATQAFELEFHREGVHVVPESRTPSATLLPSDTVSTGIGGLDRLMGGGLIEGGTALLDHDGRASVHPLVSNIIIESVRLGQAIVLLPPSSLEPAHLDTLIAERVGSVQELLDSDKLFVLDLGGSWAEHGYNVFAISDFERGMRQMFGGLSTLVSWKMKRIFKKINERRSGQSALSVVFTEAMLQEFSPTEVRQLHQWAKKNLFVPNDTVLFVQNPAVMDQSLAEFFVLDAQQLLRTWIHENGLQYLKLEKSPTGQLGGSKLLEHVDYPPYIRVQRSRKADAFR